MKNGFQKMCYIFSLLNVSSCDKYEPKPDDNAPSVQVSHFHCSEMTKNNLCLLNQVKPCNMAAQNIEMNDVKKTMIPKHFRVAINATIGRIKHQRNRVHCGMHDHTSMCCEAKYIQEENVFMSAWDSKLRGSSLFKVKRFVCSQHLK